MHSSKVTTFMCALPPLTLLCPAAASFPLPQASPKLVSLVRSRGQRALAFEKCAVTFILPLAYTPACPAPIHLPFPSTGIPELVSLLRSRGQQVFLVSGGFRQVIHPLAESLDIPVSQVFANTILFNVSNRGGSGANQAGRSQAARGLLPGVALVAPAAPEVCAVAACN